MAENRLERTAHELAVEWGLDLGPRIPSKHWFIAPVGPSQVLKVVRPGTTEYDHEADALRLLERRPHPVRRVVRMDIDYLERWGMLSDLRILARTLFAVARMSGE